MDFINYIIIGSCLIAMAYQDIRTRSIHILLPLFLFAALLHLAYLNNDLDLNTASHIVIFLAINIIGVTFYFSIKNKRLENPLKQYIGLGDIIFLVAIIPLFILKTYMLFFISGMIVSLVLHILFKNTSTQQATVPLAGYLSIYLGALMIINFFTLNNLFTTLYF